MDKLNISIIPYKKINNNIKKYHIFNNDKLINFKVYNINAPFGYQKLNNQYRFNLCCINNYIKKEKYNKIYDIFINNSYENLLDYIKLYELYFSDFEELKDYKLNSNIINNPKYNTIIRCHLKSYKDKIITPLKTKSLEDITWLEYDKLKNINIECNIDSLWINDDIKEYGISIVIKYVMQLT